MSIISYAQNFEDVMLWRALKDVENGFYVDVGANHPTEDSVTKAFYEHGWTGINIEPETELYELLELERPEDKNLNIAISSSVKSIDFFVSNIRGWSTTDKDSVANLKDKGAFAKTRVIPAMSLDVLCEQYHVKEIHFLKIDVEGAERDVLESFSFENVRPWIVVVEATKPTTQIDVSSEWQHILFEHGYLFAYFDGLNKYYVANEHSELADVLKIPPNVFDEFMLAKHRDSVLKVSEVEAKAHEWKVKASDAEAKVNAAEAKANVAETKVNEAQVKAHEWREKATAAEVNVHNMLHSSSWRMTALYRFFGRFIKAMLLSTSKKEKLRLITRSVIIRAKNNRFLRKYIIKMFFKYPRLHDFYLKKMNVIKGNTVERNTLKAKVDVNECLNTREQQIYNDIQLSLCKGKR